jgi:hypothetical protein
MKSRKRKLAKKRTTSKKRPAKKTTRRRYQLKRRIVKRNRLRRTSTIARNPHEADIQRRVFRVLRRMREQHESLSKATQLEGIKSRTFIRYARPALRRSGPGKPWKGIPEDKLASVMNVLTRFGPTPEIVHSRRERKHSALTKLPAIQSCNGSKTPATIASTENHWLHRVGSKWSAFVTPEHLPGTTTNQVL